MTEQPLITDLRFTPSTRQNAATGLLGYLTLVVDGLLRLDSVALRRTRDGRHVLAFPVRHDKAGGQHSIVAPINTKAREAIEGEVLAQLRIHREATS